MEKVTIRLDAEKVLDLVSVDEYIALEQRDIAAIKSVCGKFVVGPDGEYLPPEEGIALIGRQPLRWLMEINNMLLQGASDTAVPFGTDGA